MQPIVLRTAGCHFTGMSAASEGALSNRKPLYCSWHLKDGVCTLFSRQTYCGTVGYEYMHIPDRDRCNWLREKIEAPTSISFSKDRKAVILDRLMWGHLFEAFLSQKWTAAKRFGLEGCETLIPGLKEMIDQSGGSRRGKHCDRDATQRQAECAGQCGAQAACADLQRVQRGYQADGGVRRGECYRCLGMLLFHLWLFQSTLVGKSIARVVCQVCY